MESLRYAMKNPILRGFHPDPSVIRVKEDYFVACSTFEWFPGVAIYHSKDVVNWKLIARPLNNSSLLDIKGVPDSCGVWAPCLSHDGNLFHLVYSQVRSFDGAWKDTPNFLITASDINGPWSDPVYLSSFGFDGSMFHDKNGRKWFLSLEEDHRKGLFFGGIIMQEYDYQQKKLIGPIYRIFKGTSLGITEGPHLYQKDGYYYLLTAEGGTEYGHAATIGRSRNITGPYEISPHHPLLSAANLPDHPLQKTGHADLVQSPEGIWFIFFLVGRPLSRHGRCILGRETAIELLNWPENGWPSLASGSAAPRVFISELPTTLKEKQISEVVEFDKQFLPNTYYSLRIPIDHTWCHHDKEKGTLRLKGRESLNSTFEQSLVARRLQSLNATYSARLSFQPDTFQQMAGIISYYNTGHFYYLYIMGGDDRPSRFIHLISCNNFVYKELIPNPIPIPSNGSIDLLLQWKENKLSFCYSFGKDDWHQLPGIFDGSILSDDYIREGSDKYRPAFTGTFVGIACQDFTSEKIWVDVHWLKYQELEPNLP